MTTATRHGHVACAGWIGGRAANLVVLITGAIIFPLLANAVTLASPFTPTSIAHMAFATMVGQTVAIGSCLLAIGMAIVRSAHVVEIGLITLVAVALIMFGLNEISSATDLMFVRLDLL